VTRLFRTRRGTALLSVILLLLLIFLARFAFLLPNRAETETAVPDSPQEMSSLQLEKGEVYVSDDFETHLPLVILDTGDDIPTANHVWDNEKGYAIPAEDFSYTYGTIRIIDNSAGLNHISDTPAVTSEMRIRLRGNSSISYPKKQYLIKLMDEDGENRSQDLMGMGADNEWVLNISWYDPSLLRNYIAYTLTKDSNILSPDVRYCEVVYRHGDMYEYQGVYLLMESVKRSESRVNIPKYTSNQSLSFLLRRDRYDEESTILSTYALEQGFEDEYLEVLYPSQEDITPDDILRIEDKINEFERVLYSDDDETFLKYRDYIDIDTFLDYFLINELFLNYDAGFNSTYIYCDYTGRLCMGPVWDFDQALANDLTYTSKMDATAFHNAPWFNRMLRDPVFVKELIDRYAELRAGAFSQERVDALIESTCAYLGTAAQRDWNRWQYDETIGERPSLSVPLSFEDEVEKARLVFDQHGSWLDERLDSLYGFSDPEIVVEDPEEVNQRKADAYSDFLAVVFIAAVVISALLLQREF